MAAAPDEQLIPTEVLRRALEFAVNVVAGRAARRPPEPYPVAMRPFVRRRRLTPALLQEVRDTVVADDAFRGELGRLATPELVDEVGLLWLRRPAGWVDTAAVLAAGSGRGPGDVAERRRRIAAESAGERWRAELVAARTELGESRAAATAAMAKIAEINDAWHAASAAVEQLRLQLADSEARAAAAMAALENCRQRLGEAEEAAREAARRAAAEVESAHQVRDIALAGRATSELPAMVELLPEVTPRQRRVRRQPLGLPGGVLGSSAAAAEHLLRHEAALVLVDGYNVAKLGWPGLDLAQQRDAAIAAAEQVARRWGSDIVVVFDGADVVGAATTARRVVAVTWSAGGATADDEIRRIVATLPVDRPVVVVTNDRQIVDDVRRQGANTLPSEALLEAAHR